MGSGKVIAPFSVTFWKKLGEAHTEKFESSPTVGYVPSYSIDPVVGSEYIFGSQNASCSKVAVISSVCQSFSGMRICVDGEE
jgi:hypothetical protein